MPWTDREIINWLDELLPPNRMAEFEMEVRTDKGLQQRVSAVIRQRDQGGNSIGEIWQRARLSCPSRTDLGNYLLHTLPPDHSDYIEFHLTTIGCRLCQASLADLEWLVGDWTVTVEGQPDGGAQANRPRMEMSVRWNATGTYLLRDTTITSPEGEEIMQVSQRIGWDPLSRRLHSWSFGTDGSHSEADWRLEEGVWVSRTMTVHPDGSQTSTLNHYLYDGKDECTFQSLPTHAGATDQSAVTMTMTRKPGKSAE